MRTFQKYVTTSTRLNLYYYSLLQLQTLLWTVLLVLAVNGAPQATPSNFSLSLYSHRNSTGNWIISVDAARRDEKLSIKSPRNVSVLVNHNTGSDDDTEVIRLSSVAIFISSDENSGQSPRAEETTMKTIAPVAGYELFSGLGFYKMHLTPLTWEAARDKCAQEGAHLMIINSEKEAEVYRKIMARDKGKVVGTDYETHFFLGFDEQRKRGQFVTVLDEPLNNTGFLIWHYGYPTTTQGWECGSAFPDGTLLNLGCSWKLGFICERGVN
ncbi:hemolymph lipopolysaccharide-binding protein-like [Anabrus simplex]|uniref:hemolymph lipopolysaccharide-binding protein-like n=1 Tax=Anabrus simplex TaxID=316456 RepID=UPI0035A33581